MEGERNTKLTAKVSQKLGELLVGCDADEWMVMSRDERAECILDWTGMHCLFRYKIEKGKTCFLDLMADPACHPPTSAGAPADAPATTTGAPETCADQCTSSQGSTSSK